MLYKKQKLVNAEKTWSLCVGLVLTAWCSAQSTLVAQQGSEDFTYQRQLYRDGLPLGSPEPIACDVVFALWDAPVAGEQAVKTICNRGAVAGKECRNDDDCHVASCTKGVCVGGENGELQCTSDEDCKDGAICEPIAATPLSITVSDGLFTAHLDSKGEFGGDVFAGDVKWLEMQVQCPEDTDFRMLSPRQPITRSPYTVYPRASMTAVSVRETVTGGGTDDLPVCNGASGVLDGMAFLVRGRDAIEDGGGGLFVCEAGNDYGIDGGTIFCGDPSDLVGSCDGGGVTCGGNGNDCGKWVRIRMDNTHFNVKWFGAKGTDDADAEDEQFIQAAIEAAEVNQDAEGNLIGGTVFIPAGTYQLDNDPQLVIGSSAGVTLQGEGRELSVLKYAGDNTDERLVYVLASNVTVRDLKFMGQRIDNSDWAAKQDLLIIGSSAGPEINSIHVTGNTFEDAKHTALWINRVKDLTITNNVMKRMAYAGISASNVSNAIVSANLVEEVDNTNGSLPYNAYGINFGTSEHIVVSKNVVRDVPVWAGIDFHKGNHVTISGNIIVDALEAIAVQGNCTEPAGTPTGFNISHNVIQHSGTVATGTGIVFYGYTADADGCDGTLPEGIQYAKGIIAGNTIRGYNNDTACPISSCGVGIYAARTEGLAIVGNVIDGPKNHGVKLGGDNANFLVTGNQILDAGERAVWLVGSGRYNNSGVIESNVLDGDGETEGIRIEEIELGSVAVGRNHYSDLSPGEEVVDPGDRLIGLYFASDVGIGTPIPLERLHIKGAGGAPPDNYINMRIENTAAGGQHAELKLWVADTDGDNSIWFGRGGSHAARVQYDHGADDMIFTVNGDSEKIRIRSDGSVGVGTPSPDAELEVNGGVRLNTAKPKPLCDSTTRGTFWIFQGGAGTKDSVEVCAKSAGDVFAWRSLY